MFYYQIKDFFTSTTTIEKSKFITHLYHVINESSAKEILDLVKRNHTKANHNCYAYIVLDSDNNFIMNQSDDGEPSKTAGMPILEQLKHANMVNTLAVVTRYFGGTLLGTGGLIRAYSSVTKETIAKATLYPVELLSGYKITVDYSGAKNVEYILNKHNTKIAHIEYKQSVTFEIYTNDMTLLDKIVPINIDSVIIENIPKKWM